MFEDTDILKLATNFHQDLSYTLGMETDPILKMDLGFLLSHCSSVAVEDKLIKLQNMLLIDN